MSSSELLEKAKRQYEKGNVEGAVSSLETITEEYPSLIAAHYSLGLIGLLSGDANRAIKYARTRVGTRGMRRLRAYSGHARDTRPSGPCHARRRPRCAGCGTDCAGRSPQAQPEGRGAVA